MLLEPLTTNEQADNGGFTHRAIISAKDLTQATAAAAQTIKLCDVASGDILGPFAWRAHTFLKDASDAAFNTTTMSVGDNAAVNTHIAAVEVNENGTEVAQGLGTTLVHYTAANALNVTFNSQTGKKLSDIDVGQIVLLFTLRRIADLTKVVDAVSINK